MRESERNRLVELLKSGQPPFNPLCEIWIDKLADHLLDNGVIVAPMPMADWLREELSEHVHKRCVEEL